MCGGGMTQLPAMMIVEAEHAPHDDDDLNMEKDNSEDEMEVCELRDTDVLCGRGNGVAAHPGNILFREIVRAHKNAYMEAPRHCKTKVARDVICKIESLDPPGRFLDRVEEDRFLIVSPIKAMEKTSQALREKPSVRNSSKGSSPSISSVDDNYASPISSEEALRYSRLEQQLLENTPVTEHLSPIAGNRYFRYATPAPRQLGRPLEGCDYSVLASASSLHRQRLAAAASLSAPLHGMSRDFLNLTMQQQHDAAFPPFLTSSSSFVSCVTPYYLASTIPSPAGQFDDATEPNVDTSLALYYFYTHNAYFG